MENRQVIQQEVAIENPIHHLKKILTRYIKQQLPQAAFWNKENLGSRRLVNLLLTALNQPLSQDKRIHAVILLLNQYVAEYFF